MFAVESTSEERIITGQNFCSHKTQRCQMVVKCFTVRKQYVGANAKPNFTSRSIIKFWNVHGIKGFTTFWDIGSQQFAGQHVGILAAQIYKILWVNEDFAGCIIWAILFRLNDLTLTLLNNNNNGNVNPFLCRILHVVQLIKIYF